MSIWSNVGEPVPAFYEAVAEETLHVDIATATSWTSHTRLTLWDDYGAVDEEVLLTPDAVEMLRAKLTEVCEGRS